jgi:small-conductance mechanosensitive channel
LIVHVNVTYGYDTDWRKIHELLIEAANRTPSLEKTPPPFVLQKALDDFYCVYEINAYTKDIDRVMQVYSQLYQNIQDVFSQAGLDLTSPNRVYNENRELN